MVTKMWKFNTKNGSITIKKMKKYTKQTIYNISVWTSHTVKPTDKIVFTFRKLFAW